MAQSTVVVAVFWQGTPEPKILVADEAGTNGSTFLPGSPVIHGEFVEEAFVRYLREDLGVEPVQYRDYEPMEIPVASIQVRVIPYIVREWKGRLPNIIGGNRLRWVTLDEAGALDNVAHAVQEVQRDLETVGPKNKP